MITSILKILLILIVILRGVYIVSSLTLGIIALSDVEAYQKRVAKKYNKIYPIGAIISTVKKRRKKDLTECLILSLLSILLVII